MKFQGFALLALFAPAVTGCSPQLVAETVSKAQVCSDSARILGDMENLLVSAAANPLASVTYLETIDELASEFSALTPLPSELADSHDELSGNFEGLLQIAKSPSVGNLGSLPNLIAETQISLLEFQEACSL